MNDRYLFRGKRADNGEWVVGDLMQWNDGTMRICVEDGDDSKITRTVIPETVGQCTGLKDKNGKLIFEGDILLFTNEDGEKTPYEVMWSKVQNAYMVSTDELGDTMDCWNKWGEYYEIIGNSHDNPELLEVKE